MNFIKKNLFILLFVMVLSMYAIANDYSAVPDFTMPNVRSLGMGGNHITDTSDFYTLLRNPAGLGLCGKQTLWTSLAAFIGGPLEDFNDISLKMNNEESVADTLLELVEMNNGANISATLEGPLTFGIIRDGFGIGLFEKLDSSVNILSVSLGEASLAL